MTPKQFQRQLNTWRKNAPELAKDIEMLADSFNLLKKNGDLRKIRGKKQKSTFDDFISRYTSQYGSYTSYKKKAKERLERARRERYEQLMFESGEEKTEEEILKQVNRELGRSGIKYVEKMKRINEMISRLFENAVSSKDARNELDYIQTLSITEQEKYLSELLQNG